MSTKMTMCVLIFVLAISIPLSYGSQDLSGASVQSYGSVQYPSRLHTESAWIKDSDGNIIRLKGTSEDDWFIYSHDPLGKPYCEESKFKERWSFFVRTGANFLRFGISRKSWYSYPDYQVQLDTAIDWLLECGVKYIVLDNHGYATAYEKINEILDGSAENFLVDLAQRYKDNPAIIGFDFRNEPPQVSTWNSYKGWTTEQSQTAYRNAVISAIKAIHAVDPNYLVFFEPLGSCAEVYGDDMQYFYVNPITEPNIVYGYHIYFSWDSRVDYTEAYRTGDFEAGYEFMKQRYKQAFKMMDKGYPVANMETGAYKLEYNWGGDVPSDNLLKAYGDILELHEEHGASIAWIAFAEQDYKGTSDLRTLLETGITLTEVGEVWAEYMKE